MEWLVLLPVSLVLGRNVKFSALIQSGLELCFTLSVSRRSHCSSLFVFARVPGQNLGAIVRQRAALCVSTEVRRRRRRRRADTELLSAPRILSAHLSERVVFALSFAAQSAQCAHETAPLAGIYCPCFSCRTVDSSLVLSRQAADQRWRLCSKNTASCRDADQHISDARGESPRIAAEPHL